MRQWRNSSSPRLTRLLPGQEAGVDTPAAEVRRLERRGVVFELPPTQAGPVTIAILIDTVGNLIQLYSPTAS